MRNSRVMKEQLTQKAERYARDAHAGQFRKWTSCPVGYIEHPARVAATIAAHPAATPEMVAAAWLHDVVEDTSRTLQDIEREFGPEVAALVYGMTQPSKGSKELRAERRRIDREFMAAQPYEVKLIKLADRVANLRDLDGAPGQYVRLFKRESMLLLEEALIGVDGQLESELRELAEEAAKEAT